MPGILTVIFVVLMFATIGAPGLFNFLLGTYIAGAAFYYIYQLCGKRKAWIVILGSGFLTALMLVTPVVDLFILYFESFCRAISVTLMAWVGSSSACFLVLA